MNKTAQKVWGEAVQTAQNYINKKKKLNAIEN